MSASSAPPQTRWQQATIERIERRTPRVSSLYLRGVIGHQDAGQHVDVRLTAPDGYQAQRSYSIASAPGASSLELAIEALDGGEVSSYFHDIAQAGDAIEIRGPIGGHFVWRPGDGGPLLLVAGGSGVVPLMSIARQRASTAPRTVALFVYSARSWDEIVFRDELLAMQAQDPNFSLVVTTTRGPRQRGGDFERRLDPPLMAEILTRWGQQPGPVYVCGSNVFVEAAAGSLIAAGVPSQRIRTERFGGSP